MSRLVPPIVLVLVSCAHPTRYVARSGPDPLDCALQFGISIGYAPAAGGTNAGFLRLERRATRELDILTVAVSRGELHVEADRLFGDVERGASTRQKEHAREIVRRCGAGDASR